MMEKMTEKMTEKMEKTENKPIFMNEEEKQTWFDR